METPAQIDLNERAPNFVVCAWTRRSAATQRRSGGRARAQTSAAIAGDTCRAVLPVLLRPTAWPRPDGPPWPPSTFDPADEWAEAVLDDWDSVDSDVSTSPDGGAGERLGVLYRLYSRPLLRYLAKLTLGDQRLAEDICQETFIRAWSHLKRDPGMDLESYRPWLYTVARRLVVDMVRARRARPVEVLVEDLAHLVSTRDSAGGVVMAGAIRDALLRLEPAQRQLLLDLYYHGRSPGEVAKELDIPVGTVKSRSYYARLALRTYLTD
jgi:RNA polymerase sigma-70 factor, ECF subfamily